MSYKKDCRLIKSEIGYQLGFKLLENSNKNVKYFGALTITVFLNTHDSSVIFENCFNQVLGVLIELSTSDFTEIYLSSRN